MEERKITAAGLRDFEAALRDDEKSELTVEKYLRDLRRFCAFAGGAEIDKQTVLAYKASLEREYAVRSANSMIASMNAFFRFAGWLELCVRSLKVQRQVFCDEAKELTKAEYLRLCKTAEMRCQERLKLILQTICGTGIRVSELRFITVEAVERGEATVHCKKKTRTILIVRELRKRLLRYCRRRGITSGCVFVTRRGEALNRTAIWREMKRLSVAAGVDPRKVYPHNLRHLFARVFYAMDKDLAKLADLLGHSSINTTRIYIITTGREHRRKLEQMHLVI